MAAMTVSAAIPWKRLTAEVTVIVASILLAFSIDAWWDNRIEAEGERWLLERLRSDFTGMQRDLSVTFEDHKLTADACLALLRLSAADPALPLTPEVDEMVGKVFLASRTFNPGSGAIEVFLNSELSRLVRNQPLADLLIRWSALVDDMVEEEAQMQKGVSERWTPFLASRTDVGPILAVFNPLFAELSGAGEDKRERIPLVADTAFRNEVMDRYKWQLLALRDIEPLRETVQEILLLLDDELGS
jgi:hypothetical protein